MEYDNDRLVKKTRRAEILFWMLFILVNPLINSISFFPRDPAIWVALFLVNLVLLPAYLFYSGFAGNGLFLRRRYFFISILSLLFAGMVLAIIFFAYSLLLNLPMDVARKAYFTFSTLTTIREISWIVVHMFLALAIYFVRKSKDQRDELNELNQQNVFFQLRYLRSQLNPHFLFNTLNSIYSLSLRKSDQAPEVVVKLADIMRYLIYECNEEKVELAREIGFIRNYIDIERIRYKADIRFDLEGNPDQVRIEPFLFISFIENAFKHAIENTFEDPFIYILLKVSEEEIILNVINSSNADLEEQAKRINGKGISNSRNLLELLYPKSYSLDIIQTDREEARQSQLRMRHARERLESLYPDAYTLDVILSKNAFTVSLVIKQNAA